MAKNDVKIIDQGGHNVVPTRRYRTEAGATQILLGEPVKIGGTGSNYAIPVPTAEPTVAIGAVLGIAASDSDETAVADGFVDVYLPLPGVLYRAKATTPANIDTDAKLLALLNDTVGFTLAAGVYTVNEDDAVGDGLSIKGGSIAEGTIEFEVRGSATAQD